MAKYNRQQTANNVIQGNAGKKSAKSRVMVILLVLVIAVMAVIFWFLLKPKEKEPSNFIVTEDNKDTIRQDLQKKTAEGMFEVRMNTEWTFRDSASASENAYIANAQSNTRTIYFDIIVDATEEKVFTSPLIPVGSRLKNLTLDKELEPGTYPATVLYHLVDDNGEEVSSVAIAVSLTIQN